ncbi:MAG: TrbG/VirB9 family P-type conjugative transfer protein [Bryobacteraceae bacterium]|nr:TrbG/VirB9 family P-type conjugative transfer protein [Bryobacteraceae bacterium]
MIRLKWILLIVPVTEILGQTNGPNTSATQVQAQVVGRPIRDGQVTTVYLAPRYVTAIRMPEPINSVVLGDPVSFSAEHSEREPNLVFIKPITSRAAQSNLLVSSTRGLQTSLLLISAGDPKDPSQPSVDFLLRYRPAGQFIIQPTESPSAMIPQTLPIASVANAPVTVRTESLATNWASPGSPQSSLPEAGMSKKPEEEALNELLERQRRAPLPLLYGQKPGITEPGKELVKTGISEVIDQGSEVVVLFSVMNVQDHAVELMPPQIQLGGRNKTGKIIRRSRWSTSEQLPVTDFRMSRRRLGPDERADGVVVFKRPSFKQSTEMLFLQMAESGAVDRPALAPIGFGISSFREVSYDAR